jgi:hypothetical protein
VKLTRRGWIALWLVCLTPAAWLGLNAEAWNPCSAPTTVCVVQP